MLKYFRKDKYDLSSEEDESIESGGYSYRSLNILLFTFLIPTDPLNTTKEEILAWMPDLMTRWKENPYSHLYKHIFTRLISDVVKNFIDIDLSEYDDWIFYQMHLFFSRGPAQASTKPFSHLFMHKYFAMYVIFAYKVDPASNKDDMDLDKQFEQKLTISSQHEDADMRKNFDIETIMDHYLDQLHPECSSTNSDFLRFVKLLTSYL